MPYLLAVYRGAVGPPQGLVVPEAIHCGVCEPRDEPVPLEILERG